MTHIRKLISPAILSVFGGVLLALSFPEPALWILAWIALIPLMFACRKRKPKQVFGYTFIFSLVYFTLSLAWIRRTMIDYGGLPVWLSLLFLVLLACYCAIYPAAAFYASYRIKNQFPGLFSLILPASWVTAEYIRSHLLTGFPWNCMGQSQYTVLALVQNADWGSFYGLSFLMVGFNVTGFQLLDKPLRTRALAEFGFNCLLICFALSYGYFRLSEPISGDDVTFGVVQGNLDQHMKWNANSEISNLEKHLELSRSILAEKPAFIVWSESALTFYYRFGMRYQTPDDSSLGEKIKKFVKDFNVPIITGTLDRLDHQVYNSACLIPPYGMESYYYKT
ncbi:apolipoprotein N-acyltransferase, partial [bacterium]|nr:apolipoprotein N-acyltransferase [candidate division CSSED10-310 bacterium]